MLALVEQGENVAYFYDLGYSSSYFMEPRKHRGVHATPRRRGKSIWEIARGKRSCDKKAVWDARKGKFIEMGVVAMPIWHAKVDKTIWLVVGRRGNDPLYFLTDVAIETIEQAWNVVGVYARRWQIEVSFRYEKSELAIEGSTALSGERESGGGLKNDAFDDILSL